MEQPVGKKRNINPKEKANLLSRITFFYNYKILQKGKKSDLEESDIYKVIQDFQADRLGNQLEAQWRIDRKTGVPLWRTLVKCYGIRYIIYTFLQLILGTILILLQPKAISNFVGYFQWKQSSRESDSYLYAASILGLLIFNSLYTQNLTQLIAEYSLKIRTAVCSLIYRKALRMSPVSLREITIGKAVTLITKDVFAIDAALTFLKDVVIGVLHLMVVAYVLYDRVGNAAFSPITAIVSILPLQLLCGKLVAKYRLQAASKTDARFKITQEALSSIMEIKMFCWQDYFESLVNTARRLEINKLTLVYYLKTLIGWLGAFINNIAFYLLLLTIVMSNTQVLQADTVYFVQQCLFILRMPLTTSIPMGICNSADLWAAFKRIQAFLDANEVPPSLPAQSNLPPKIYMNQVKVSVDGIDLLQSVSLSLVNGLTLVTGNLGSGKSALLKTLLREYPIRSGIMEISGTISYAPQEPWLFPGSIRQNIIFGQSYDPQRYQEVLKVCALTHDLNRLEHLDETIVGDNGFNLSKGQQARVSLARAIYRESDIYLLDDCLSSVDNSVSDHIFDHCLKRFLKGKICLFVTNNVHVVTHIAGNHVVFIENGRTLTLEEQYGGLDKRITYFIDDEVNLFEKKARHSVFQECIKEEEEEEDFGDSDGETLLLKAYSPPGNGVYQEDKRKGGVSLVNYTTYFKLMGGWVMVTYLLLGFAAAQATLAYSEKLLSVWVNGESKITSSAYEEALCNRTYYLKLYTLSIVASMTISIMRSYCTLYTCLKAARALHNKLVKAMLNVSMTFFDNHYIGNIVNRLGKDLYVIDEQIPFLIFDVFRLFFNILSVLVLVASVSWLLLLPGLLLIGTLYCLQRMYLPTGRSLRRLEASTRSPIIGHLNATLEGLSVIRSAQQEATILEEFDRHQDLYTSAYYMNQTTLRFFAVSLDMGGVAFVAGVLLKFLLFYGGESAGDVGLVLSQAMTLSAVLQYAIKQAAEVETAMTSVERVLEYAHAQAEPSDGKVPVNWPSKGKIELNNVSLTYHNDKALKDVCLQVSPGSKVGIVGRTGSGKTSLVSSLFRLYEFQGVTKIDGEDIAAVNLWALRRNLTIISQDPLIFSGSIRSNLDPFQRHTDEDLWRALEKVRLKCSVEDLSQASDSIASSGEKQLLCLARALLQRNKIIILDEVTANLDHETELVLEKILRDNFSHCTVLIIAHKLHTVMWCDKVVTFDDGTLVEFDSPFELMRKKDSLLKKMIREDNFETFVRLTHI